MQIIEKGLEKNWRVLSFRNLFWFPKLRKQSLNNVVMSTLGTWRITYHNKGAQVIGTDTDTDSLETRIIHFWEAEHQLSC